MVIKGNIYGSDRQFHKGFLKIDGDVIKDVAYTRDDSDISISEDDENVYIDAEDRYVIPGLIDIHLHGALGFDIGDASREAFEAIAEYELSQGVTGFLGATMTMPAEDIVHIITAAGEYISTQELEARHNLSTLIGLNVEGPFISPDKCGAQNPSHILKPDLTLAEEFIRRGNGIVKILGLAPEMCNDITIIKELAKSTKIAITHSNSNYDIAMKAINMGANHITHLFNGMTSFTHREPGILGALIDNENISVELITDGVHVHPATVRMAFRLFSDSLIIISDSMRGCGLGDGIYSLGDQDVEVKDNKATILGTNNPAGSVSNLYNNIKEAYRMGLPLEQIIAMATIHPAKCVGVDKHLGSLETGKKADILILDKNLNIEKIIKSGKIVN